MCFAVGPVGGRKTNPGFTLPEMSVSAFLLAILLVLTMGAMSPGLKVSRQAEESIAAQREVVMAFDQLMAELALMDRSSLSTADGALAFLSHRPYRGDNGLLDVNQLEVFGFASLQSQWQKFVVLGLRDGRITRREFPYDLGSTLARVRPDRLDEVLDQPAQEKPFARDVEAFEATPVGTSRVQIRVRSVHRGAKKPEACDVTFQVAMRGGS